MALDRSKKESRKTVRSAIASYLETSTKWGKLMARPSQIRAAAKKMQMGGRIPRPVAIALGIA
jgi:hypothetical protein